LIQIPYVDPDTLRYVIEISVDHEFDGYVTGRFDLGGDVADVSFVTSNHGVLLSIFECYRYGRGAHYNIWDRLSPDAASEIRKALAHQSDVICVTSIINRNLGIRIVDDENAVQPTLHGGRYGIKSLVAPKKRTKVKKKEPPQTPAQNGRILNL